MRSFEQSKYQEGPDGCHASKASRKGQHQLGGEFDGDWKGLDLRTTDPVSAATTRKVELATRRTM